jgi:hypothetical protein
MTARTATPRWNEANRAPRPAGFLRDWIAKGRSSLERIGYGPRQASADGQTAETGVFPGLAIRNSAGVPGTAGCVATLRRTDEPVLVTSYHMLFARGSDAGMPVIAVDPRFGFRAITIGSTLHGKAGLALGTDPPVFVDAAAIRLDGEAARLLAFGSPARTAEPRVGDKVFKHGAATGRTEGVIVDIAYPDQWYWEYRSVSAPRQILIRPLRAEQPFSASGDSGAAIRNAQGAVVGLLWGTTARGEGVASPIVAVAAALGIGFAGKANAS